jgi:hypothetical protein
MSNERKSQHIKRLKNIMIQQGVIEIDISDQELDQLMMSKYQHLTVAISYGRTNQENLEKLMIMLEEGLSLTIGESVAWIIESIHYYHELGSRRDKVFDELVEFIKNNCDTEGQFDTLQISSSAFMSVKNIVCNSVIKDPEKSFFIKYAKENNVPYGISNLILSGNEKIKYNIKEIEDMIVFLQKDNNASNEYIKLAAKLGLREFEISMLTNIENIKEKRDVEIKEDIEIYATLKPFIDFIDLVSMDEKTMIEKIKEESIYRKYIFEKIEKIKTQQ